MSVNGIESTTPTHIEIHGQVKGILLYDVHILTELLVHAPTHTHTEYTPIVSESLVLR